MVGLAFTLKVELHIVQRITNLLEGRFWVEVDITQKPAGFAACWFL